MKNVLIKLCLWSSLLFAVPAQGQEPGSGGNEPAARSKVQRPAPSPAAKAALAAAKELLDKARGLTGAERIQALERAASAYDKVVGEFVAEAAVAASAAFTAAGVWRQQGSLPLAEKDYLAAAKLDADRYAQRGWIGAADMQRRQKRYDDALGSYDKAAAIEPGSGLAHDARLWRARTLQSMGKIDEAIAAFQATLEAVRSVRDTIETTNDLALAWIAKGDLDAAGHVIDHADEAVANAGEEDPVVVERHRKALEAMSARKALQRARDKQSGSAEDAARLEAERARKG